MNRFFTHFSNHRFALVGILLLISIVSYSQNRIKGRVIDADNGDPLIGANVLFANDPLIGTTTDYDGYFELEIPEIPFLLNVSYIGYSSLDYSVQDNEDIEIRLETDAITIDLGVEVKGQRLSDKQKQGPLTIESLDILAIKETPSSNFYEGLGSLKDVDLTTASLGFTVINTRGFNSTSPVRSLQIIDGVDNQSPGLNFSLGNFLGSSELDVKKVDLIVGASSAFYGPNAFNGVISMETKNPFILKGLSAQVKVAERNLFEAGIRWATSFKNKNGDDWAAIKINAFAFKADDWKAENYNPVDDIEINPVDSARITTSNPGGFDAVNIYGDEFNKTAFSQSTVGIGRYYRNGYKEVDLVDYGTKNQKASCAAHFRLQPSKSFESPELILSTSYGGGTTVYQGDNRFSLRDIKFFQHRIEINKRDKYFFRVYATHEDAGKSYDPFFTALKLQELAKDDTEWNTSYLNYWSQNIDPKIKSLEGLPLISQYPGNPKGWRQAVNQFLLDYQDSLVVWHQSARDFANTGFAAFETSPFYEPGTERFQTAFDSITSLLSNSEGGTRFYDKSALFHAHGEYQFNDLMYGDNISDLDITIGASGRYYLPDSKGSILLDTFGRDINTYEYGIYAGGTMGFYNNKIRSSLTCRMDKHQNFNYVFSPAASIVFNSRENEYFRLSFSSAVRNPTLTDQYLNYNVGPAILLGNIDGYKGLLTVESFVNYLDTYERSVLDTFDVAPIQPEKVKTFEFGYRSSVTQSLYVDLSTYYSIYKDFIGYQLGIDTYIPPTLPQPSYVQAYRVSANAKETVTTQGFSLGLNYYFGDYYQIRGNYSYNNLITNTKDPIIPAFNTPKNKYNIGLSGRNIPNVMGLKIPGFGFSVNYKWVEGFLYEGSPQFTGFIPSYDLLDAQINFELKSLNTVIKMGASNVLNNKIFQTYGGPRIGRMAYISATCEFDSK
ncbi:MAG TPA: carboxypeptidase-like regulatory domain-containing protein [Saprospiraceae bacterium]|nr:carboxypeptidase-like regulatory domain-containing protein [Saprospiraceae bacterium]